MTPQYNSSSQCRSQAYSRSGTFPLPSNFLSIYIKLIKLIIQHLNHLNQTVIFLANSVSSSSSGLYMGYDTSVPSCLREAGLEPILSTAGPVWLLFAGRMRGPVDFRHCAMWTRLQSTKPDVCQPIMDCPVCFAYLCIFVHLYVHNSGNYSVLVIYK